MDTVRLQPASGMHTRAENTPGRRGLLRQVDGQPLRQTLERLWRYRVPLPMIEESQTRRRALNWAEYNRSAAGQFPPQSHFILAVYFSLRTLCQVGDPAPGVRYRDSCRLAEGQFSP